MKKKYMIPQTEMVNIRLLSSFLDDTGGFGRWSQGNGNTGNEDDPEEFGDAKETAFDIFDTEEDIWSGRQTKDAWER
ncbi:MAG: hypothetical protein IKP16_04910 [Prevotella sp.]|nr:hypothetical protein [Prevotella sp.]